KNWKSSQQEQEKAWKNVLDNQIKISERLENIIREAELDYKKKVEEALEEIGSDIQFLMKLNSQEFNFTGVDGGVDFRALFNIGGILLTLGGVIAFFTFTPLAILSVVGPVVSLFKHFFQSKEKRQQEICEKIEKDLKKGIENKKKEILLLVQNEFYKFSNTVERNLDIYFNSLIKEINLIESDLSDSEKILNKLRNNLNGLFALRIFSWCAGFYIEIDKKQLYNYILRITRKPGDFFNIYLKDKKLIPLNRQYECSQVLSEKVSFY
ncbi:MAG: hypothetical protein VKJ02_10815, partial [Snowella sp.]|nr:hypothetical protein [Snowella sp.]